MGLEAQELSCLWVGRGRAELPPVALEVGEAAAIPQVDNPEAAGMLARDSTAQSFRAPILQGQSENSR